MLRHEAGALADLSELAEDCAACFSRARCAGCDIRAIAGTAKAAMRLGAGSLQRSAVPYPADAACLDDLASLMAELRRRVAACMRLHARATARARLARRGMAAALAQRPPDRGAYASARAACEDAMCAAGITAETAGRCRDAIRLLAGAQYDFAETYENPQAHVARGGVLPGDGRWIAGEAVPAR